MNFYSDIEGSLDLKGTWVFIWLTVFNPWTYTQIHTPPWYMGGGGRLNGTPPQSFDMLHDFETILPSLENLWSSWQDEVYFMGGDAAEDLWRHQQWSPSWIYQELEIRLKPGEMVIFCALYEK